MGGVSAVSLTILLVGVSLLASSSVHGGKILVFPVDGSHWVNMNLIVQSLHARGHEVTVVRTATSWYVKESAPHYRSITLSLPEAICIEEPDFFRSFLSQMLKIQKAGGALSFVRFYWKVLAALSKIRQQASLLAAEILQNKTLVQSLRDAHFDVVLIDPGLPAGLLVAHELKLPTVLNVRWVTSGDGHAVVAPSPTSYVPVSGNAISDRMTFAQRLKNTLFYFFNTCFDKYVVCPHYDRLVERFFGPHVTFYHLLQGADLWLIRVDFVFEFPRPSMPNVVYIGGFQCKPPQPLPPELEDFVLSSGEHGFVLMSLGSLVQGLPSDVTAEIAAAFAQIPQKVIWRHVGKRPKNLGNNTLLVKWLPQNDLLGHPKIKAFVGHGGTNGIYESIYHGVPVIGMPLLFDQWENVLRLEVRGAAKVVQATELTRQNFLEAVREVLHEPTYRENMRRLSALHRDQPMHPLDTALFWIQFAMRHKGAAHFRSESFRMPWYSYHSLDVGGLALAGGVTVAVFAVGSVKFLCFCRKGKSKRDY